MKQLSLILLVFLVCITLSSASTSHLVSSASTSHLELSQTHHLTTQTNH